MSRIFRITEKSIMRALVKNISCYFLFFFFAAEAMGKDFPITNYGAKPGMTYLNTVAINKAIDACYKSGGGRVVVPAGVFRSGMLLMKNNVELYLEMGANLVASTDLKDFPMQKRP